MQLIVAHFCFKIAVTTVSSTVAGVHNVASTFYKILMGMYKPYVLANHTTVRRSQQTGVPMKKANLSKRDYARKT